MSSIKKRKKKANLLKLHVIGSFNSSSFSKQFFISVQFRNVFLIEDLCHLLIVLSIKYIIKQNSFVLFFNVFLIVILPVGFGEIWVLNFDGLF